MPRSVDLQRNISLHLGAPPDIAIGERELAVLAPSPVPSRLVRGAERVRMKLGVLDWQRAWLEPLIALRRSVLGERASGPPRFLVRVDEFPYYSSFDQPSDFEMSRRFHEVMASAGVAHLMAVVPQLTHAALDPDAAGGRPLGERELGLLAQMRRDRVTFAQHGTTHRTRYRSPRRRSELCGLGTAELERLLGEGAERLLAAGLGAPRAFVPPFNRFDAAQYPVLARRFDVVCGGPESTALMGFHGGPLWRGEAVYLPCYAPLYADARTILPAVEQLIELQVGTWIPLVLHTSWEQGDEFRSLRALAERVAPFAAPWEELLAELDRSAAAAALALSGALAT